jgi:hypothetical protein
MEGAKIRSLAVKLLLKVCRTLPVVGRGGALSDFQKHGRGGKKFLDVAKNLSQSAEMMTIW